MNVRYQTEELNQVISDFYHITGINLAILDRNFCGVTDSSLYATGFCSLVHQEKSGICAESDRLILERCSVSKKPEMHICHAGLIDIALPILYQDTIMGYIIMGQMRRDMPFSKIAPLLSAFATDQKLFEQEYETLICYNDEQAMSAARLAVMLTSHILTKNMIKPDYDYTTETIIRYINENLAENLSISSLCTALNLSKNVLYEQISQAFGCTVNEYITDCRIRLAKEMLLHTTEPIGSICEQTGIMNDTYFCRLFKKKTGLTPLQYRKQIKSAHSD